MKNSISYKTSSPSGDLISFLSGVKQIWMDTGRKAILYHRLGMIGGSYEGADSAYEDAEKNPICFNQYTFDMMRPLLLSQEYIEDYIVFTGQKHDLDLDKLRMEGFTNQPRGSLNRWANYLFPEMASDLSQVWLNVPKSELYRDKVILNFTKRHRNTTVNYFFLKPYEQYLVFAGLPEEKELFCKEWQLNIPLLTVENFYELAQIVKGCKFLLSNQSMVFQIAEAIKVPRILECFPHMPNVIPVGENSFDFYHQGGVEFYFNKLLKSEKEGCQTTAYVSRGTNGRET